MRTMVAITLGLVFSLGFTIHGIRKDVKQIKHQVNEVICVALEMEETLD